MMMMVYTYESSDSPDNSKDSGSSNRDEFDKCDDEEMWPRFYPRNYDPMTSGIQRLVVHLSTEPIDYRMQNLEILEILEELELNVSGGSLDLWNVLS